MNIEEVRDYCLCKKAVTEAFPFDQDTLVFKVKGKMFVLTSLKKWEQGNASINLKCDPEWALELRANYNSIEPGFHMNKTHWNTIYLHQGELSGTFIRQLIDHSYNMVIKTLPKKIQQELLLP